MKPQKIHKPTQTAASRRLKHPILRRRRLIQSQQHSPDFLIRLIGKEQADYLFNGAIVHYRHD